MVPSRNRGQELKSDKIQKSDPDTVSPFENSDTKVDIPRLTDTLTGVLPISTPGKEEQMKEQCNSSDRVFVKLTQMTIEK